MVKRAATQLEKWCQEHKKKYEILHKKKIQFLIHYFDNWKFQTTIEMFVLHCKWVKDLLSRANYWTRKKKKNCLVLLLLMHNHV